MKQIEKGSKREDEMFAMLMLLDGGWKYHTFCGDAYYDILITDPVNGDHYTVRLTRIYQDKKRGDLFISRKNPVEDADINLIFGVLRINDNLIRGFLLENKKKKFYHYRTTKPSERWIEHSLVLNRSLLAKNLNNEILQRDQQ